MQVTIGYSDAGLAQEYKEWESVIHQVLAKAAEVHQFSENIELSVLLCDNEYIHRLNYEYRNIDRPTDVLSFALNEGEPSGPEEANFLGDLIISVEKVKEQAATFGHSQVRELAYLTVHGFLHIIGYDHMKEADKQEMRAAEEKILGLLSITREDIHGE